MEHDDTNDGSATSDDQIDNTPVLDTNDEPEAVSAPEENLDTRALLEKAMSDEPEEAASAPEATAEAPQPTEAPTPGPKAPVAWTPAVKEKFSTLPGDVQEEIARRENEMARFVTHTNQERTIAKNFMEISAPYHEGFKQAGIHPFAATKDALALAHTLVTGDGKTKAEAVARLFAHFDIDINEASDAIIRATDRKQATPAINPELDGRLKRIEHVLIEQPAHSQRAAEESKAKAEVEAFAKNPKNIHLQAVAPQMQLLLHNDKTLSLQDAYETACYMNPEIRKKLAAHQGTDKARLAAGAATLSNNGPRSVAPKPKLNAKSGSIRDTLSAAWEQTSGRG